MADKEIPSAAAASSPISPQPKRVRTISPPRKSVQETVDAAQPQAQSDNTTAATVTAKKEPEIDDVEDVEADDSSVNGYDSGCGTDKSDTTSISSSIYAGYIENGRRYQTLREGEYWGPSDEKQFEAMQAAHLVYLILDSQRENNLFHSPIPNTAQNILDIGTGNGAWAVEVADRYPAAFVQGVDLYPPPETWVPPNCKFEVDDVLKQWVFDQKFDLIHMRDLFGSFTDKQWAGVYKQAYNNLAPGGWIEEVETGISFFSDDGTLPADSLIANWGPFFTKCFANTGKPIDTIDHFKSRIEAAGFTNVREKLYKVPMGEWAKNPVLKEAGKFCKAQVMGGIEGYTMFVLTKYGEPEPWSAEEVQVYLAKVRKEVESGGFHSYLFKRRVWAQKPYDADTKVEKEVEVENLA